MAEDVTSLIGKLKDLASDLQKVPTRREFVASHGHSFDSVFKGSYTAFLHAAGFKGRDLAIEHKEKLDSAKFIRRSVYDLDSPKLNSHFPLLGPYPKIVAIGDIHAPFTCKDSMNLIYQIISQVKPDYVVTMGDSYDFFSQSKFPKQIQITPDEEVEAAQTMLAQIYASIHEAHPKAKKYALRGNHDIRPIKRLIESAPELMPFFEFDKYFKFDNVETIYDTREPLEIGGIAFIHGYMNHGSHMRKLMKPVVHGHLHRGGVTQTKIDGKWLFEMDCGYVGNPGTVAFNYTTVKETRWTRGVGIINEFGPNFIPFE